MFNQLKKIFLAILLDSRGWTAEMNVTGITEVDAAIPEYWGPGIFADANRESFWGSLSGKEGSFMPVIDKTGKLKENGDKLTFNVIEQLMGTGVTGESVLKGTEEKLGIGSFTVTADYVRHAVALTKKSTRQANFECVQQARSLLKDWFSRKFDNDVFTAITDSSAVDTIYAGSGNTAVGNLNATDGDYFGPTEINMIRMALIRQGASPLKVTKSNGRTVPIFGIVYGEMEEYYLNQNTAFVNTVKEAWERFKGSKDMHPLFEGAVGIFRNMVLYPYYSLLPIPQGTPLRPETTLSATLVTSASTAYVGVAADGNTKANYTLFFASTGSLQIDDEIISYTGKTVSTFTGLTRGVSGTTDAQHTAGALVTQRDVATVIGFGSQAVFRAMPEDVTPIGDSDDYGAQIGLGLEAYYGYKVKTDKRRGKANSLVMCKCISPNPGTI